MSKTMKPIDEKIIPLNIIIAKEGELKPGRRGQPETGRSYLVYYDYVAAQQPQRGYAVAKWDGEIWEVLCSCHWFTRAEVQEYWDLEEIVADRQLDQLLHGAIYLCIALIVILSTIILIFQ